MRIISIHCSCLSCRPMVSECRVASRQKADAPALQSIRRSSATGTWFKVLEHCAGGYRSSGGSFRRRHKHPPFQIDREIPCRTLDLKALLALTSAFRTLNRWAGNGGKGGFKLGGYCFKQIFQKRHSALFPPHQGLIKSPASTRRQRLGKNRRSAVRSNRLLAGAARWKWSFFTPSRSPPAATSAIAYLKAFIEPFDLI